MQRVLGVVIVLAACYAAVILFNSAMTGNPQNLEGNASLASLQGKIDELANSFNLGLPRSNGGAGQITTQGYAWPIGLGKAVVSNGAAWPCNGSCHHDGTAALDLAHSSTVQHGDDSKTAGVPVYAIYGGTIQKVNNSYAGIAGCYSFQLVGNDGWHYWYGHIANVQLKNGQTVAAGQQVAQVGPRQCTGNGSYPHLHIDRGSPKGRDGGSECCRDTGFVTLMNSMWTELG